jgi:hypothetical protein
MIDVHRREAAFIVVRIPERQLLAAISGVERVVDVEDIALRRRHMGCELIDESARQPRRIRPRRRILETADGRL